MQKYLSTHRETERLLISVLMLKPDRIVEVFEIVKPEDFIDNKPKAVFTAQVSLFKSGEPLDLQNIHDRSNVDVTWLADSTDLAFGYQAQSLARKVAENAYRRRVWEDSTNLCKSVMGVFTPEEIREKVLTLYNLTPDKMGKDPSIKAVNDRFTVLQEENRRRGSMGTPTGFDFLTSKNIEYVPGHFWAVGGYTSVGKTSLAVEMVTRLIGKKRPSVVIISTEMTEEQNEARILANQTGYNSNVILSGNIHSRNLDRLESAKRQLSEANLTIYENTYSLPDIVAKLRKADLQGGVDVVFIDYIQNCTVPGTGNEYSAMRILAQELQALAKTIRATIVCFSQIPNNAAKEDSGILEFKGAGEIAACADLGVWLKRSKGETLLGFEIRKNRHGPLGKQVLEYKDGWTRLEEVDHAENE